MRPLHLYCLGLASLMLVGCSGGGGGGGGDNATANDAAPEDRYTVRAGPVSNAEIAALSGTFQLLKSGAPDAIPSAGLGGACLVFAAADLGYAQMAAKQCQTNRECYTGEGESAAYCDTNRQCWARPGTDSNGAKTCNRPLAMTAAVLNPVPRQPVNAGALGVKAGTKARVVACLNKGSPPFPGIPPCGQKDSVDRIEVLGPVATVK